VALLTFVVGLVHFKNGVTVLIEDYVQGLACKIWIIVMTCVSYAAIATAIFAIARIAL
jgi:succinate dehydrogenase / fumarate reductase membrane anchor subunit